MLEPWLWRVLVPVLALPPVPGCPLLLLLAQPMLLAAGGVGVRGCGLGSERGLPPLSACDRADLADCHRRKRVAGSLGICAS